MTRKKIYWTLCIISMALMYACQPPAKNLFLYKIVNDKVETDQLKDEPLIWAWEIELYDSLLRTDKKTPIKIILDDKQEINITLLNLDTKSKALKWHGQIEKSELSLVTFVMTPRGTVAGNIRTEKGELYKIRAIKEGRYLLAKIDASKYPDDVPALKPGDEPQIDLDPCPNTDPASKIDIMVLYTDDTRTAAGSVENIESEILLAVEETNRAYINSNVVQRINLVYMAEVSYTETGDVYTDAPALQSKTDGVLDNIHTLRDNHSADIVALIVETLNAGISGGAYTMETVSTAHESWAFAVIKRTAAAGNFSFAHELGHIMGCQHDCDNNTETVPYVYAHGYYNTSPTPASTANWRTIMSYRPAAGADRICYFSNPGITYPPAAPDGDVMGTTSGACQADNHLTLNNTALTVANFRCTGSGITNVWMKDTWNDTGQEPDPNTVSESMWKSPYIWVRNAQDPDRIHQHQHQNPLHGTGIANWIYVKLHNGGATISGNLEVYYANASISLSWPIQWTLINSTALTIGGSTTEIAEIEWPATPGTGHYCLVARWNSASDPMHAAEGTDIGYNVRQNNNIVWRNVNIESAVSGDEAPTASFRFSGGDTLSTRIRVSCNDEYPNKAFALHANLVLELDQKSLELLQNWTPEDDNIIRQGDKFIIKGVQVDFTKLPFGKDHNGEITLTFETLKDTPKMIYFVDVTQLMKRKEKELEIGGVSYEINTQLNAVK